MSNNRFAPKNDIYPGRPAITVPEHIDVPQPETLILDNGIRLYTLDCSTQDVVRVSFVFRAGTSLQHTPFSASSAANLLAEGTGNMSAMQIAEKFDFYGSHYEVSIDRDYAVISLVALSKYFGETISVFSDILLSPTFPGHELKTYASKRKQRLAVERSKVGFRARELFASTLFGDGHPYGVSYHQDLYDELRSQDLKDFFNERYTAGNCFVVCSGKIKEREKKLISILATSIPSGGDITIPQLPPASAGRFSFAASQGALQSAIRIGRPLFPRMHPDYIATQVAATVLGGYFGSRLVRNLREDKGYTYGVFAAVANLEQAGYMAIATEVATEATEDSITQIYAEMERLREERVSAEELDMVKNIMTGEVMRILDGPFGIADVTIENIQNGSGNDYLEHFLGQIRSISPERVMEIARQYLDPTQFTTVVVGAPETSLRVEQILGF